MPSLSLPAGIANQAVPTYNLPTNPSVPSTASYEDAMARFDAMSRGDKDILREVSPDQVSASIMAFLEGIADDEGGNAARYFPAILVARMARRIARDLNASLFGQ